MGEQFAIESKAGFISKDKTRARRSSDLRETGPIVTGPGADLSHLCESGQLFRVTLIIADSFCYSRLIAPVMAGSVARWFLMSEEQASFRD